MLRGFFVGALVGFAFGSSKKGNEIRQQLDGLLTDLMPKSNDEEDMSPPQEPIRSKFGKEFRRNRTKEQSRDGNGNSNSPEREDDKPMERGVPMDKAVELAEALNAKPTTPPTEELEPGEHAIGA